MSGNGCKSTDTCVMPAGIIRRPITVEVATEVNAFGGPTATWATHVKTSAAIQPLRGRELYSVQQVSADTSHKVTMRYYKGVTPKMRVKYGTRTLEITSVINIDERNRILELMCKEAV